MPLETIPIPLATSIYQICTNCKGTGKIVFTPPDVKIDCTDCSGTGKVLWGEVVTEG
jgi:DnaJ-class molecular chaperone